MTSRNGPTQPVFVEDGRNAKPLERSTHRIRPQWTQTWEGREQQEAQGIHTTGLDVFVDCQDMNESTLKLGMYTFHHAIRSIFYFGRPISCARNGTYATRAIGRFILSTYAVPP